MSRVDLNGLSTMVTSKSSGQKLQVVRMKPQFDLIIIGGGVNGCAIARDAVGRGLSVCLLEKNDLASATSSGSTKLFHGGLRYLEYYEFGLVRKALKEREVLLRNMPHISWPMRFVLPHHTGLRPAWLLRLGLFLYDYIGGRKILPATKSLNLSSHMLGAPLQAQFTKGFEYSDCWVDDARLVMLNAKDARARGADIRTRTEVTHLDFKDEMWTFDLNDGTQVTGKVAVNAAGPWVERVLKKAEDRKSVYSLRLVRGSHIVVNKLFDHDRAYIFQQSDGRIIFAIPYEDDFTLIGTTDAEHEGSPDTVAASDAEVEYLCKAASEYFKTPIKTADVVWNYSAVRPLINDGAKSAAAATRDYILKWQGDGSRGPLLNIFGGKITTHRKLAEKAVDMVSEHFPKASKSWTAVAHLPGGDFDVGGVSALTEKLVSTFPFLGAVRAARFIRLYGTCAFELMDGITSLNQMGHDFGAGLTEVEVQWQIDSEFAQSAQDVLWRRTKMGLRLSKDEISALDNWFKTKNLAQDQG